MTRPARTIDDVSAPYANFMANPAVAGSGVCATCWTFIDPDYRECYPCSRNSGWADLVVPITYSVGGEQMHHALRQYKDGFTKAVRDRFSLDLAAVVWRFLRAHEKCLAAASGAADFGLATVVPSSTKQRDDERRRLRYIVGGLVGATEDRYDRVLMPTDSTFPAHQFDASRYVATRRLDGERVLLVDDTWTTGASLQGAAYALKQAGASRVAGLVIGRHITRGYQDNDARLRALPPFDWSVCAVHV